MESAVVLRQREAQQLQRTLKKLVALVDRLMPVKAGEGQTKVRRARQGKREDDPTGTTA